MTPKKQVSPAIRILRGERDASARATHLEAATRKFLVTTNERKYMSTKTNFKRIALVAVTALGLGVLNSVPSQAAPVGPSVTVVANGTAGIINGGTTLRQDSTTSAKVLVNSLMTAATDSLTVSFVAKATPASSTVEARMTYLDTGTASSTGLVWKTTAPVLKSATSLVAGALADSLTAGGIFWLASSATSGYAAGTFMIGLDSAVAVAKVGTYTFTVVATPYTAGTAGIPVATDVNIVVSDATLGTGNTSAAGTSTAVLSTGTSWAPAVTGVDDVVTAASTPPGTEVANIRVTQKTSDGSPARESITVTTNIGNLGLNDAGALGKSLTFLATTDGIDDINVYSDGSSGTATITVKTTSVTFAAKTVTFYSTTVDKYTVTQLATVIGSSAAAAFVVTAIDATGNVIKETVTSTVYAYSSDLGVVATAAAATSGQACTAYSSTYGGHYCQLTGSANGTATITIRDKSTVALSTVSAVAGTVTVNLNVPVKIALAFDKATYAPGEVAYLTVSATDASDKPVAPGSYTSMLKSGGITSSVAFGNGSASAESMTATTLPFNTATSGKVSSTGVYTVKVYMPASGGAVEAYVTGGTALAAANQVKLTAKATVTDSGAAALAAVTALATTVASLKTLITTLTNLVLKIQKKVKA